MRDEYYANMKDVWKWSVVAGLAIPPEANRSPYERILYVAMMRPDEGNGDGQFFDDFNGANQVVADFFRHQERQAFGLQNDHGIQRPLLRRVRRITRLGDIIRCPIAYVGAEYRENRANQYFTEQVLPWLSVRQLSLPIVVLIDPDTGISQTNNPGDTQVAPAQIQVVWTAMRSRDVLVIYVQPDHNLGMGGEAARLGPMLPPLLPSQVRQEPFPFDNGGGLLVAVKP